MALFGGAGSRNAPETTVDEVVQVAEAKVDSNKKGGYFAVGNPSHFVCFGSQR